MAKQTLKPGQEAQNDVKLYVKDGNGKTVSEINVPAGHRVPPTRTKGAQHYTNQD